MNQYPHPPTERNNKYQYNQKELSDDFGLWWNDYGARWQDPQLGRWHSVDPLAEKYPNMSPYNYVAGNPIRLVDPDGRKIGWYEREDTPNAVHHEAEIKSQADLEARNIKGTYLGESMVSIDETSGKTFSYNTDGTITNSVLLPDAEVYPPSWGRSIENYTGLSGSIEINVGPQLGCSLGRTELQGGGNYVLFTSGTPSAVSNDNTKVNIFAEATRNGAGIGGEISLSGPSIANLHNFDYEAGGGIGPVSVQAEGHMGPGQDKHSWGVEGGERKIAPAKKYGIEAFFGLKLEVKKK